MKRMIISLACLLTLATAASAESKKVEFRVCSTGYETQISAEPLVLSRTLEGVVTTADPENSLHGAYLTCSSFIKNNKTAAENHHFVCVVLEKSNDMIVFGPGSGASMQVVAGTGKWSNATGGSVSEGQVSTVNMNTLSDTRNSFQGCVDYSGELEVTQ